MRYYGYGSSSTLAPAMLGLWFLPIPIVMLGLFFNLESSLMMEHKYMLIVGLCFLLLFGSWVYFGIKNSWDEIKGNYYDSAEALVGGIALVFDVLLIYLFLSI